MARELLTAAIIICIGAGCGLGVGALLSAAQAGVTSGAARGAPVQGPQRHAERWLQQITNERVVCGPEDASGTALCVLATYRGIVRLACNANACTPVGP